MNSTVTVNDVSGSSGGGGVSSSSGGGGVSSGGGGGGGGVEGGGGFAPDQQSATLPAAFDIADEAQANSANVDADIGDGVPEATPSDIHRVDSLTLAIEAIRARQAAATTCIVASSEDVGCVVFKLSATAQDPELPLLANSNSPDLASGSGSGSSAGEEDLRPKRASSLKLPRRQNDTRQPKKAVRFADAMGLDLTLVRQVFDLDSPPVIPPQAMRDLVLPPSDDELSSDEDGPNKGASSDNDADKSSSEKPGQHPKQHLYLSPSFAQPGSAPNFNSRVTAQKVVLEKAYFHMAVPSSATVGNVRGMVRVANLGFEKSVRVKATFDAWQHCVEVGADFQPGGSCGNSDQFAFSVAVQQDLKVGDRVAFCVVYSVNGLTYWDNNFGDNYSFHCVAINNNNQSLSDDQEHAMARYI